MSVPNEIIERVKILAAGHATFEDVISSVSVDDVLEASPDGVVMVNESGQIIYTNREARSMFRYPRGTLIGQQVEVLLPERLRARHLEHRQKYATHPMSRMMGANMALTGLRKTGEEFPLEISLNPVFAMTGLVVIAYVRELRPNAPVKTTDLHGI